MKNTFDYLHAGLLELSEKNSNSCAGSAGWMLGCLEVRVSNLIEGAAHERKEARQAIGVLIDRGRCLLNAKDFDAGLRKGQHSICGNPAYAIPCHNPNAAECGDCLALPPERSITSCHQP